MKNLILVAILCGYSACAVDVRSSSEDQKSTGTTNFCQDGDTGCQCGQNPGLPQCSGLPNPVNMADYTYGYAVSHAAAAGVPIGTHRAGCSGSHCWWTRAFAGILFQTECDFDPDGSGEGTLESCQWSASPCSNYDDGYCDEQNG
jgi:hypothetical protein